MTEHTKGKLESPGCDGDDRIICYTDNGKRRTLAHVYDGQEFDSKHANAARLVACWNACEGIPTEALNEAMACSTVESVTLRNENTALRAANKVLVEALEGIRDDDGAAYHSREEARDALSQVKP